jgi:hypothetical protein
MQTNQQRTIAFTESKKAVEESKKVNQIVMENCNAV